MKSADARSQVLYPSLDVTKRESIRALAEEVRAQGKFDVLINNAGVNLDNPYTLENVRRTMDVNYGGTLEVSINCEYKFAHLIRPSDRRLRRLRYTARN